VAGLNGSGCRIVLHIPIDELSFDEHVKVSSPFWDTAGGDVLLNRFLVPTEFGARVMFQEFLGSDRLAAP
jgi:hypothetical protein